MAPETILAAENLTVQRESDRGQVTIARQVSFHLNSGQLTVLTGPSGSGKTSLLWALARLLPAQSGRLLWRGSDSRQMPATLWRTQIALLQQVPVMVPGTIAENILLPYRLRQTRRNHTPEPTGDEMLLCLRSLGLDTIWIDGLASELSTGQASRVALARIVLSGAECLLLDEPVASLDAHSTGMVRDFIKTLANDGRAVLLVDHSNTFTDIGPVLSLRNGEITEQQ